MSDSAERPNPPRRGVRKGLYLIPSAFTAGNIGMGFWSVMESLRGFQLLATPDLAGATAHFDKAAITIGFALLFDMLDGRIARLTKTTTEIGVQLDSIADVVTFGLAPAVLAYVWGYGATLTEGTPLHRFAWFLSFMYLICGAFRLARFNVQASRPRVLAEGTIKVDKKSFVGLPIPPAAGLLAAIVHFAPLPLSAYAAEWPRFYSIMIMTLIAVLGLLMVSTLKYTSFKKAGAGRRSFYLILVIAAVGMSIYLYSRYVLLALAIVYVSHGVIWYVFSAARPRRSQTSGTESNEAADITS